MRTNGNSKWPTVLTTVLVMLLLLIAGGCFLFYKIKEESKTGGDTTKNGPGYYRDAYIIPGGSPLDYDASLGYLLVEYKNFSEESGRAKGLWASTSMNQRIQSVSDCKEKIHLYVVRLASPWIFWVKDEVIVGFDNPELTVTEQPGLKQNGEKLKTEPD